jgi:hypothetical protein
MDNQQYETYELILKDDEDEVFALSLVNSPAIQSNFVYFSEDGIKEVIKFATADEDQRTIVGPILIPELKILRMKEDGKTPYYVTFSRDTVRKIAQKYIRENNANNITLEHTQSVDNISLVESWITESSKYDKSKAYGLTIKPGTWMGVFKVDNQEVWNKVKSGEYKGISLEGLFSHELIKASMFDNDLFEKEITDLSDIEANIVLNKIKSLFVKLEEGVPHYTKDGELYEGPTHKDSEGNLMTGATHSEDSEYLYHKEDLEAQPSIPNSTYPGERAKKIIAPALISND